MRTPHLEAWRLRLPLREPYRLAFGPVEALDTVLVRFVHDDGAEGYGEATLLTGYTDETIEGAWGLAHELVAAAGAAGFDLDAALERLDAQYPFLVTAFRTAREMASGSARLDLAQPARVPILGLLQGAGPEALHANAEALLAQGYRTLKVKVGFDAPSDAAVVAAAQAAVRGRARLRIDANQGYTSGQAIDFVSRIEPEAIELFEQPCAALDWAAHAAVVPAARERGIALMLDESIYELADIERAAATGACAFVKVKLMKLRDLERLVGAIERIRALGLEPVLGNGVAAEPGCWMEACVAARHIDNAGEMNGFLKPRERLFEEPLAFRDGAIEIPAHWRPRIDRAALERHALDHVSAAAAALA